MAQVMACCLRAISEVLMNFMYNTCSKITSTSPRDQWYNTTIVIQINCAIAHEQDQMKRYTNSFFDIAVIPGNFVRALNLNKYVFEVLSICAKLSSNLKHATVIQTSCIWGLFEVCAALNRTWQKYNKWFRNGNTPQPTDQRMENEHLSLGS